MRSERIRQRAHCRGSGFRQNSQPNPNREKSAQLRRVTQRLCMLALIVLLVPVISPAYSVLSHEAIIDSSWEMGIKPLLLARYPNLNEDQLHEARGYAYGGSVIQDLGYY